ncbi:putative amidoligase enzyme-domain-containing protein [Xylaria grammica]|nr:putative amidoligase enzyme-domain-containing protein [Xylaria grammica]
MSLNVLPNLDRPTFGVEVEFMIATLPDNNTIDPHKDVKDLPPVLRIPIHTGKTGYAIQRVRAVLEECFSDVSFATSPKFDGIHRDYRAWIVHSDPSVRGPRSGPYRFISVEIASPVQSASPDAFYAIRFAVSVITSKFRCMVNSSCGLHVHVGLGNERIPLEHIRRFASLSYAAEALLFTLHEPHRRVNDYCRSLRDYSYIANEGRGRNIEHEMAHYKDEMLRIVEGETIGDCYGYIGRDIRHGEEPLSVRNDNVDQAHIDAFLETRQPGHFEPFTKPGDSRHTKLLPEIPDRIPAAQPASSSTVAPPAEPARKRNIPRLRMPRFGLGELLALRRTLEEDVEIGRGAPPERINQLIKRGPGPGVFEVTEQLYAQPATCFISMLLDELYRPATNFENYSCYSLDPSSDRRTVEIRFGSGSLDAEWVATWAKIVVGLFRFALYASPSMFIDVLDGCDRADKEDGSYDVIDLLDDLGLFAEAEIAEKRLMANKDRWNLTFVEPES